MPLSISVHRTPSISSAELPVGSNWPQLDPAVFVEDLLDRADEAGLEPNDEAALHEVLDMMSCKAAVKAGDSLAPEELSELLRRREQIERASNCPHGRPTAIRLSLRDLEKQFKRT